VSFWLLGTVLALAAYSVAVAGASLLVAALEPRARGRLGRLAPAARASRLLDLCLLPSLAGLVCITLVALAWLLYEPRAADERPGFALGALALAGLALIVVRAAAAAAGALRTGCAVRGFRRGGRELAGLPLPASCAPHPFPVAALAGLRRPRLLLADGVLRALGEDELHAVVAHELAHLSARDNVKRLLLRASPDPLALTRSGRRLRADFLAASEAAADNAACARVEPTVLARAIVKVARLVPDKGRLELDLASFNPESGLAARVQALLAMPDAASQPLPCARGRTPAQRALSAVWLLATAAAAALALGPLHRLLERVVGFLG
jgi:hypothetical protein